MKVKYETKYALVRSNRENIHVTALNGKSLSGWGGTLLEKAILTIEDGVIEIKGTEINKYYHSVWGAGGIIRAKSVPSLKIIYNPEKDLVRSWCFGRLALRNGVYEMIEKKDFQLASSLPWTLESSNGEVLSSEELA